MKPKKPSFNSSELPSPKGITAKPAKMRDASPNFVNDRVMVPTENFWERRAKNEDPGTNPENKDVPKIKYREAGGRQRGVRLQTMTKEGKFEFTYPKNFETSPDVYPDKSYSMDKKSASSMPVKNEQLNTIMDKNNKNLKIGNAKKVEKYIK
jgi:hypothetical protein